MAEKPTYKELKKRVQELEQLESKAKRTEEALRESLQIIEGIVNAIPVRVFWKDKNLVYLGCNALFAHDAGFADPKDIIGKDDCQMVWCDQAELYRRDDRQIIESGDSKFLVEEPQATPQGNTITLLTSKIPLRSSTGEIIGVLGTYMDITDRKQTEKALRESEKRFRLAFQTSPDPININRLEDGIYIDINEGFTKVMGYSREEVIGNPALPFEIWKNPEDRERLVDGLTKTGYVENMEAEFVGKDGKIKNGLISSSIARIGGENVMISITRDITDRKQAEETLRQAEKKYRMIAENTSDLISILDLDTMRLTYASPSVKKITGYTVEEYLNRPLENSLTPQSLKLIMKVLSGGLKRNTKSEDDKDITGRTEWQEYHKNGHLIWVEAETAFIRDDHGKPIGVIGVSRDISERKKTEEEKAELEAQLRQSQKMESLGTLAGGVAHNINNILAVIIGNTELAVDYVPESNPAGKCLKEILSASLRAKDVVSQILGFARKSVFQLMPVKMGPIISETLTLIMASVPATIEIRQDLSYTSDTVMADSTQISQVLINLCDNAKKAMQAQGGVLEVKLENALLDEKNARRYENLSPGNYLKLTVGDTGRGIDPNIIDRIFDPYFTTASLADAAGMGLAVVHGIVKHHNGAITAASEPGKGSVFEVLFPVTGNQAKAL